MNNQSNLITSNQDVPEPAVEVSCSGAIYIRCAAEQQVTNSFLNMQEMECREAAEKQGIKVFAVYRDDEPYQIKNRLIKPSGKDIERPGLSSMLQDASTGKFHWIIASSEDRLYRDIRAITNIHDTLLKHKIKLLFANGPSDMDLALIKLWVGQIELNALAQRMSMGVKLRLSHGMANSGQDRYGYKRREGSIEIVEDEALWVRQIYAWYNQGAPVSEIRECLINGDAVQKRSSISHKTKWGVSVICSILSPEAATSYATGVKIHSCQGEVFEMKIPVILDISTYQKYLDVRKQNPSRRVRVRTQASVTQQM